MKSRQTYIHTYIHNNAVSSAINEIYKVLLTNILSAKFYDC